MQNIFDTLSIPLTCKINRKLFKKQFIGNFSLNANEKNILSSDIESITLEYILNKDKINITPFTNEENDYSEVAFISVELLETKKLKQIINIIQYIPYPLIVVFSYENSICINISPKRINKNDNTKLVVEENFISNWINLDKISKIETEFLKSLEIQNQPFTNFFEFYNSYLNKLIAFNASEYSGSLEVSEDARERLREIQGLEAKSKEVIVKIKKETNIRDKVNLNIELKKLSEKIDELKGIL